MCLGQYWTRIEASIDRIMMHSVIYRLRVEKMGATLWRESIQKGGLLRDINVDYYPTSPGTEPARGTRAKDPLLLT